MAPLAIVRTVMVVILSMPGPVVLTFVKWP